MSNGAAEGKVSSPLFWSLYILPLIGKLRKLGLGCRIAEVFVAAVFFADDIILISPNRQAAQLMLNVCQNWSRENGIMFSTDPIPSKSKTKAMRISPHKTRIDPVPLLLDGKKTFPSWTV